MRDLTAGGERDMLSTAERVTFLKDVAFFEQGTDDQLTALAAVCEEAFFPAETRVVNEGDAGGILYMVVRGRVGIDQQRRPGSFVRLATTEAAGSFGEMNFFDESPCTTSATAMEDSLLLLIRREALVALVRQEPDLLLEMCNVLSLRLRQATDRIAELSRPHTRELHKLFDQL
jgi:CRP/FNR family cyclic AMP-dependent transcriptional regulator